MQKIKANEIIHISEHILRILLQNRITTILEFLQEDIAKLSAATKLSLEEILAARNDIFRKYAAPLKNGTSLLVKHVLNRNFLRTGVERLDTMLEGGLPIGYVTELCGLADSGKTQFCFQFAINCAKHSENSILYINTKGDISAVRIQKILAASGHSHKEMAMIMHRIRVVQIWTMEETLEFLQRLKSRSIIIENLALIILDSLPSLMFQFLGDDNKIGLSMLNTFVNISRYLCKEMEICMICVNIQTRWIDQDVADLEDDGDASTVTKDVYIEKRNRCLGKYWGNIPNLVLLLEKVQNTEDSSDEKVIITVTKFSNINIEQKHCTVSISNLGVT